jgi:sigma-B regulation protein RsbU (phosphoserine phosphatase)
VAAHFGLPEKLCALAVILAAASYWGGFGAVWELGLTVLAGGLVLAVLFRLGAKLLRGLIWSLRNRLIVAYLFIAGMPIVLLLALTELGAWSISGQIASYLLDAEMDRRINLLRNSTRSLSRTPPQALAEAVRRVGFIYRDRLPGLEVAARDANGSLARFPDESTLELPEGFGDTSGLLVKDGLFYLWAYSNSKGREALIVAPVTRTLLIGMVPSLGDITLRAFPQLGSGPPRTMRVHTGPPGEDEPAPDPRTLVPPAANQMDLLVAWGVSLPVSIWEQPRAADTAILGMRTRISRVLSLIASTKVEQNKQLLYAAFAFFSVVFLIVELAAAVIGVSITRSITGAVHNIYEGTARVKEGDFSHRIHVSGKDQLAELGQSFNSMTSNLERLVSVEKERERLQTELEIASEVQNQLHPKALPQIRSLRLASVCHPARMVSGDYFDYQEIDEHRLALAIGDVAGKGISAALLMATLQSALRCRLRLCMEANGVNGGGGLPSPSRLVADLNVHLHASTSPEKYATFFFSAYDDTTGVLTYTNAGHLPPMLVRNGAVERLETNGTVVGAFPFVEYEESRLELRRGDLLVFFTDGVTEPENAYGEMFGEERLAELLRRNAALGEEEILTAVTDAVREWTSSPELQDDMTLLVARRL